MENEEEKVIEQKLQAVKAQLNATQKQATELQEQLDCARALRALAGCERESAVILYLVEWHRGGVRRSLVHSYHKTLAGAELSKSKHDAARTSNDAPVQITRTPFLLKDTIELLSMIRD